MLHDSPPKPAPSRRRPDLPGPLRDPLVVSILVYTAIALLALVTAYYTVFSIFAAYDDEGTVLVTLNGFLNGHVLFKDVYTPFGPFYYELFGGLFDLTGKAVDTDTSRSIVAVLWVLTSFLYGISVQRLTRRLTLGAAGMIVAFGTLSVLANEPMHAQVLCVLLLGTLTALAVFGPGRRPRVNGTVAGAVVAALVLTKLNLGSYALAASALAAVLTLDPLRSRAWVRWPVIVAVLAMPAAVAVRDLGVEQVRTLVALEFLAMGAVIVAAHGIPFKGREKSLAPWVLGMAIGFGAGLIAMMVAILLTGPSLSDVYGGMVTEAMRVREVNPAPVKMPTAALDWGIAALAVALIAVRLRRPDAPRPGPWSGGLRIFAGLVIWLGIARIAPVTLNPSPENPLSLPLVLAWLAVFPPGGMAAESEFKRYLRVFLPALAVAEAMQVYPVAGSQMFIAALTFVPVGALCIADGLAVLQAWSAEAGRLSLERFGTIALVALIALVADLGLNSIARPGINWIRTYHANQALPFAGATDLHLPEAQAQQYVAMVNAIHQHHCSTFIGYPNVDSFYLWAGIEPPVPYASGAWILALDSKRQQLVVDQLRAARKPCAVRSEALAELWLEGREVPQRPLVRYIFANFRPVKTAGEWEFMLPKKSATS